MSPGFSLMSKLDLPLFPSLLTKNLRLHPTSLPKLSPKLRCHQHSMNPDDPSYSAFKTLNSAVNGHANAQGYEVVTLLRS